MPGFRARHAFDRADGAIEMLQLAAGLGVDQRAKRGQVRFPRAFEQGGADVFLELAQHHRHRRGRAAQNLGGVGEAALFGDRSETAQHFDLDRQLQKSLSSGPSFVCV